MAERFFRSSRLEEVASTGLPAGSPEPTGDGQLFYLNGDGRPSDPPETFPDARWTISVGGSTSYLDPSPIAEGARALDTDLKHADLGTLLAGRQFALECQRFDNGVCKAEGDWANAAATGTATVVPSPAGAEGQLTLRLDLTIQPKTGSPIQIHGTQSFAYQVEQYSNSSGDCS